jgi:hypothetical protein
MRLQYLPRYPQEIPLIELSSPTLPVPLLRQLEKKCSDIAKENLGSAQVRPIYEHLNQFIQGNMFVPCWKELKQVTNLCEGKGAWGVDEKEGVIQLRLQAGQYRQVVKIRVPVLYPEEGVKIEFTSSTFPADMQHMFRSQAEAIVCRCVSGFTPDMALSSSNPIQLPATKSADKAIKLTSGSLKSLKHDVNVLKQMSDLRDASSAHKKKVYVTQATAERREARKDLRRLAKAESEADQEMEKQIREAEQSEMKELLRSKISDVAQPSLLAVARFLIDDYATRLPREVCQACRNPALPEDPSSEALRNPQSENRPMRTFCGHWLHYRCLNEWLTTPPFVRQCSACDRRIWHPDWPEDHKQLEKAWQTREARKREVSDVSIDLLVWLLVLIYLFYL